MSELNELIKKKKTEGWWCRWWWVGLVVMLLLLIGSWLWFYGVFDDEQDFLSPKADWWPREKPLQKYSFVNLRNKKFQPGEIKKEQIISQQDDYTSWLFSYQVDGKKVTGQMNLPSKTVFEGEVEVVVMIRGFVEPDKYQTGMGTSPAAIVFAKNGYITLAPDFLGFGQSDLPARNVFEARFSRVNQVLQLLANVEKLLSDDGQISIWGHSNGGQVALSVLEVSGKNYPTSLWAPVSKSFPYSILYYTDEFSDKGKALRKELAGLEASYDVDNFSIDQYYDWIQAPIQIHQGANDDAVPVEWSQDLDQKLDQLGKETELFIYDQADHNLVVAGDRQGSWSLAVARSMVWFSQD